MLYRGVRRCSYFAVPNITGISQKKKPGNLDLCGSPYLEQQLGSVRNENLRA